MIDVFIKYACVKCLKNTKPKAVPHGFIEVENKSTCKPNKLWID